MKSYDGRDALLKVKSVILHDKTQADTNFIGVLKSDLAHLLNNYVELTGKPKIKLEIDANGVYQLQIKASAEKIKGIGVLR